MNAKDFRHRYGPWAVVTGASSGIGQALAVCLAQAGLNLVIVARRQAVLEELAADLTKKYEVSVRVAALNLASPTAHAELEAATEGLETGLLVAAAGFGTAGLFLESDYAVESEMLAVNCQALLSATMLFGKQMAERRRGGIILLSSIVGFQGMPYAAHYAATKAYVQTLAEGLHYELAPLGVDVLAAAPGPTQTEFAARADMKMGNALRPEDIAQPILNALERKTTVLPGFLSKLLVYSLIPLPRWARIRIMGSVMHSMTKHQNK